MSIIDLYEKSRKMDQEHQKGFEAALKVISGICVTVIVSCLYKLDYLKSLAFSWVISVSLFLFLVSLVLAVLIILGNSIIGKVDTSNTSANLIACVTLSFIFGFVGVVTFMVLNLIK